ncbi:MAG: hypothetical protein M1823_000328 [Watsoniomyces obsoletus]|nr:MAG: hypothetical protein M1823_000328 [Watsoniomyces obsoletus]
MAITSPSSSFQASQSIHTSTYSERMSKVNRSATYREILPGFADWVVSYCLRQGAAYALSVGTSDGHLRFLLGHQNKASTYWSCYKAEVSTIDFHSVAPGLEAQDITMMVRVSLQRRADAPRRISQEGLQRVMMDPRLQPLDEQYEKVLDEVVQQHGMVVNASQPPTCFYQRYQDAWNQRNTMQRVLSGQIGKEEYCAHFRKMT